MGGRGLWGVRGGGRTKYAASAASAGGRSCQSAKRRGEEGEGQAYEWARALQAAVKEGCRATKPVAQLKPGHKGWHLSHRPSAGLPAGKAER